MSSRESQALKSGLTPFPDWNMSMTLFLICSWISFDQGYVAIWDALVYFMLSDKFF